MDNLMNMFNRGDEDPQRPQQPGQQSGQPGQPGQTASSSPISGVMMQLQTQVDSVIDRLAGSIPGAQQFTEPAKQAIGNTLQGLQGNLERFAGDRLNNLNVGGMNVGNIMGGGNQPTPPPPS